MASTDSVHESAARDGARTALLERVFPGDSDMARLCRAHDWASTPLGPVEAWSEPLRVTAATVMESPFGMMLTWGEELIQIYNDGQRDVIGIKHPRALGRSVRETWTEIWSDIGPLFEVVRRGDSVSKTDLPLRIYREEEPEEGHFTFSYSPVRGEAGEVEGVLVVVFDTTTEVANRRLQEEREELYRELEVERARLEEVFERAPSALVVLRGPDLRYELTNAAHDRLVGDGRSPLGRPLREVLPETVRQGVVAQLESVLRTGVPISGTEAPLQLDRPGDARPETRYVDYALLPLTDASGERTGVVAHGVDVTEQVEARREIERLLEEAEEARGQAERANRSKTDFLSAMSHELRTPLNAIGGYTQLIEMGVHGPVTEAQKHALERITEGQRHLLLLIQDILSYARLDSGRLEFDIRAVSVAGLLVGVESLVLPQAKAKEIALGTDEIDEEVRVLADPERARQILLNLAGNAVKFTDPGGSVRLSCSVEADTVHLSVQDDGRGIDPEDQSAIFDAFRQVGRRSGDTREGLGLGLAISYDLARAMDGTLDVESTPGVGSTFTLTLPRARPG